MKYRIISILLLFVAMSANASQTLYTCHKDGILHITQTPLKDCPDTTSVEVPVYKKPAQTGLRDGEKEMLSRIEHKAQEPIVLVDTYRKARLKDERFSKCQFFKQRIKEAMTNLVDRSGMRTDIILAHQIKLDKKQAKYYCTRRQSVQSGY